MCQTLKIVKIQKIVWRVRGNTHTRTYTHACKETNKHKQSKQTKQTKEINTQTKQAIKYTNNHTHTFAYTQSHTQKDLQVVPVCVSQLYTVATSKEAHTRIACYIMFLTKHTHEYVDPLLVGTHTHIHGSSELNYLHTVPHFQYNQMTSTVPQTHICLS